MLSIFIAAVLLRAAVVLTASIHTHQSITDIAMKWDGSSYIAYAKAMLGDPSTLTDYDRRVFPGYPALIAAAHLLGMPFGHAALLIDWLSAGVAAAAAYALFGDRRVGWAMLFLLPHYLCNSSLSMSEAPLLAFTTMALVLARRDHPVAAGVLFGLAALIRPMACFAAGAWGISRMLIVARTYVKREPTVILRYSEGSAPLPVQARSFGVPQDDNRESSPLLEGWRPVLVAGSVATVIVLAGVLAMHIFTGDALRGVKIYRDSPQAYVGRIFQWPFHSLIFTPSREMISTGFVVYIYIHVAIVLFACGSLTRRVFRAWQTVEPLDLLALFWLISNTLFQLCIGSGWGFRHFPRFAAPSQPALFWALLPYLPRNRWIWFAGAAGVFVLAVVSVAQPS